MMMTGFCNDDSGGEEFTIELLVNVESVIFQLGLRCEIRT